MKAFISRPQLTASFAILACVSVLAAGGIVAAAGGKASKEAPPVPDFTKGGKPDENHDWLLGPTGAHGWIYGFNSTTGDARQILVTSVAKGSPADGILKTGDVILGVGEQPFDGDARIQFARAIMTAEQEKSGGTLPLTRWRDGKSEKVSLKLAVMGTYSDTAPYNCQKSKKIFELGCQTIAKKGFGKVSIPNDLNALALLASGKPEYKHQLAAYAKQVAVYKTNGMESWNYGYADLFLAEYVLATHDMSVMEGLRKMTAEIARGASAVGTWGHGFARPSGNCDGYGCMNQPGIVLAMAMVVARDAGVKDPEVDRVVAKASQFLRWYVNKGAIPYGDHQPWPGHEDNGKCSSAAVLFDLLGDREATLYFSKMSTAAYSERERGHTGNFFNILWAMPGVSRCGPLATGAYLKEQAWYYDLARDWDGSFIYQGSPVGEEEHKKYTGWDCTGLYLLAYALPLKSLCVTGKKPTSVQPLNAGEVAQVIAAGRDFSKDTAQNGYSGRKAEQLLADLSSWSPAVRKRSAQALGRTEGNFVPTLLKMLAGTNRDARYGACEALEFLGPRADAAASQLRALLKDPDPWLQTLACKALPALGNEARKASVSDLLAAAVRTTPSDPRRMAQRGVCLALFAPYPGSRLPNSILAQSLDGVDRKLLYPAVQSVLLNDDAAARGSLHNIYNNLTDRDLAALMPAIVKGIHDLAPSNEMFGDGIRLAGLELVSRLHIRDGLPLCIYVIEPDRWGMGKRLPKCLECLARYGTHAKEYLPQLKKMRAGLAKPQLEHAAVLDKAIAEIEASKDSPTLVDVKDFIAHPTSVGSKKSR